MSKDYRSFFGLSGPAFNKQLPIEAIYRYRHLEELHYYLGAAVADGAVAAVTGPVGVGKFYGADSLSAIGGHRSRLPCRRTMAAASQC